MRLDLMLGDCLERMAEILDGSIGHVVTDPPYGQSNEGYDGAGAISLDPRVWAECHRVTGPDAALIAFTGGPTYHRIATAIEAGGWRVRQMWGWVYRDGFITSAYPRDGFDRLAPAMDPICFATKGRVILPLEREGDNAWDRATGRKDGGLGCPSYSARNTDHGLRRGSGHWPKAIVASDGLDGFQYFVLSRTRRGNSPEKTGHPNQKPIDLMRWIVRKLPRVGRRPILDPFAGGGTTLKAAALEGFDATGIERDPAYFAMAERWIAKVAVA